MSTWRRLGLATAVLSLATAACSGDGSGNGAGSAPDLVSIGLLVPLTGMDGPAGREAQHGAQLAVDVVNNFDVSVPLPLASESGLPNLHGAKLKLIVKDTGTKTQKPNDATGDDPGESIQAGANAVSSLTTNDNVAGIVGAYNALVTAEASQRAERLEVPFVSGDSPVSYLTRRGLDWFFRTGPTNTDEAEAFFSLLASKQTQDPTSRVDRLAVLYPETKGGYDINTVVHQIASQRGYRNVRGFSFPGDATDLAARVADVKRYDPQAVFVSATPLTGAPLVAAVAQAQYKPGFIFNFGPSYTPDSAFQQAKQAAAGLARATSWSAEIARRNPAAAKIAQLYRNRYNSEMTEESASSFTAVFTLAQAIDRAGSVDRRAVRSAMLALDVSGQDSIMPWAGISFSETHQNSSAGVVVEQFSDGAFHPVYPADATTRTLAWPASAVT